MTHVSEIDHRPDPKRADPAPKTARFTLYAVTVAVAVLNVAASLNLYKSTLELREIDERLSQLSAFEKRMLQKFDGMNNGIQNQFDRVSGQLQATLKETKTDEKPVGGSDRDDDIPAWKKLTTEKPQSQYSQFIARQEPSGEEAEPEFDRLVDAGLRFDQVSYERIVSPDGKTFYRKRY